MHQGYVALLDVLGFSALVAKDSDGARVQTYLNLLNETMGKRNEDGSIEFVVFSDSVILTTRGDDPDVLRNLISRTAALYSRMLANRIAVRGAISYGSYIREALDGGVFVAGSAIIDAYHFEQMQHWVGIMLAPSVVEKNPGLEGMCDIARRGVTLEYYRKSMQRTVPWAAVLQPCSAIPFKGRNGTINDYRGLAVVPGEAVHNIADILGHIHSAMRHLTDLEAVAPEPDAQQRYQSTVTWLEMVRQKWLTAQSNLQE